MKRWLSPKIGMFIVLIGAGYLVYYILLRDNFFHCTIASIVTYTSSLNIQQRLFVLALLPIYISLVVFGTAMLAIYVGSRLEYFISCLDKKIKKKSIKIEIET